MSDGFTRKDPPTSAPPGPVRPPEPPPSDDLAEALDLLSEYAQDPHSEIDSRTLERTRKLLFRTGYWTIR